MYSILRINASILTHDTFKDMKMPLSCDKDCHMTGFTSDNLKYPLDKHSTKLDFCSQPIA